MGGIVRTAGQGPGGRDPFCVFLAYFASDVSLAYSCMALKVGGQNKGTPSFFTLGMSGFGGYRRFFVFVCNIIFTCKLPLAVSTIQNTSNRLTAIFMPAMLPSPCHLPHPSYV
ncbi:hypothetical protein V8F20_004992 [Naviculisporaceae sp. PSN 640]